MSTRSDNKNNALAQELQAKGMTDDMERQWLADRLGILTFGSATYIAYSNNLTGETFPDFPAWDAFGGIIFEFGSDAGIFGPNTASSASDQSATETGSYREPGLNVTAFNPFPSTMTYRYYIAKDAAQAGLYMRWYLQTTPRTSISAYTIEYNSGAVNVIGVDPLLNPVAVVDDGADTGFPDFWVIYYQFEPVPGQDDALFAGASPAYTAIAGGAGDITQTGKMIHANAELYYNQTIEQVRQLKADSPTTFTTFVLTGVPNNWPGQSSQIAPTTNQDMWLNVFIADGATSGDFNDAAYEWLQIQGVPPAALPEMWDAYWVSLLP